MNGDRVTPLADDGSHCEWVVNWIEGEWLLCRRADDHNIPGVFYIDEVERVG